MTSNPDEVIQFYYEDIDWVLPAAFAYVSWLHKVAASHGATIVEVQYIFGSDDYILDINKQYLQHDYYTDIITFPYSEGQQISADIFISVDRVEDNASTYGVSFEEELCRVMAHGILHLIGFGDKTDEQSVSMRSAEDQAIALFKKK